MHTATCLNCEHPLSETDHFCAQCGQNADLHRISFHELGHDTLHYVTHADTSIFRLLKELALRPGLVAREYIRGRRQKYFKPLNFFLIVAGLIVFMTSLFYTPNDARSRGMEAAATRIADPQQKQHLLQMAQRTRRVNVVTQKYSNIINMMATPLLSLVFWLAYRRSGYNYAEALVANMYFIGFIMLFYTLLYVPLSHFLPGIGYRLLVIFFLFELIYRGFAYYQFIGRRGPMAVLKAYGISLLVSALWIMGTYSLITYYIRHGF